MVYEPREDSLLLASVVERFAEGIVLDMGTGSGIQAEVALKQDHVWGVWAADIDPEAIEAVSQIDVSGIDSDLGLNPVQSDMFENIDEQFDTIICNTPYLPSAPKAPDVALDGGPKGYEWTLRFLKEAKGYLKRDGHILLLISSLTNQSVVEESLLTEGYAWTIEASQKIFFEELFVYRITFALPDEPSAVYLAKGKRSRVYQDGNTVIKVADTRRVTQEVQMLKKVNKLGIGPKFIKYTNDRLYMEFIDGERIEEFIEGSNKEQVTSVLKKVVEQLTLLDENNINKSELTKPYKHIIVRDGNPVLIDFERAKYSERPQNVSQFQEYIKVLAKKFPQVIDPKSIYG